MKKLVLIGVLVCGVLLNAQTELDITDEIQSFENLENRIVKMYGTSELHLTSDIDPLPGSVVKLYSEDAWVFFDYIRPSVVDATLLEKIQVMDSSAVRGKNVRVVQFVNGAVVIPHSPDYLPLTVFDGADYSGTSMSIGLYDYYRSSSLLSDLNDQISSFTLKRGYMATFAVSSNGSGPSKVYVAQDGDIEIANLPPDLNDKVSFVRVIPWRWANKKGWAGSTVQDADKLNSSWRYDWDNVATSTLDVEYIPMRHNRWWNSYENINNKKNSTHVLAFNEPERPDQANMTVAQVLAEWPNLLASGLRLGSPAPSDGGLAWLYDFLDQVDARNYRVDFVAVHYYKGGWSAQQYYNWLKDIHQRTGRPLWITEWNNGANWTCCEPTYEQQKQIIGNIITMLDTASFVERYSIYNWVGDTRAMILNSNLTPAGEVYRDNQSPMAYNDPGHVPAEPSGLQGSPVSSTQIRLDWTDNSTNELGFKIERKTGDDDFVQVGRTRANAKNYRDDKLMAATEYTYRIVAYNSLGPSAYSNEVSVTTESGLSVLAQDNWKLHYVDSEEKTGEDGAAVNAFDGNVSTFWHTKWDGGSPPPPHEIQIDLGKNYGVAGFLYLTRQDGNYNGTIADYEFYTSTDGTNWGEPAASGKWAKSFSEKRVEFDEVKARYIRLVAKSEVNGSNWSCIAELNVLVGTGVGVAQTEDSSTPFRFVLQQNYPNPFNGNTFIHYTLPIKDHVRLDIYDIMGHRLVTLVNEERSAGAHSLSWDGRNDFSLPVSSGLYLCRLRSGSQTQVIKMHLLK